MKPSPIYQYIKNGSIWIDLRTILIAVILTWFLVSLMSYGEDEQHDLEARKPLESDFIGGVK